MNILRKPKVSIIIPVYNVEEYLKECLDSVRNQTLVDIQIICVNDGSTDNSKYILDEYCKKDARFEVINKKNGGLSSARNIAISLVRADYLTFLDSDDYLAANYLEEMYNLAEKFFLDLAICNAYKFDHKERSFFQKLYDFSELMGDKEVILIKSEKEKKKILNVVVAWNKLFNKSFYKKNNFQFPEGLSYEDNLVAWEAILKSKKLAIINKPLIFYRLHPLSLSSKRDISLFDALEVYTLIYKKLFHKNNIYDAYKKIFIKHCLDIFIDKYKLMPINLRREYFCKIKKMVNNFNLFQLDRTKLKYYIFFLLTKYGFEFYFALLFFLKKKIDLLIKPKK